MSVWEIWGCLMTNFSDTNYAKHSKHVVNTQLCTITIIFLLGKTITALYIFLPLTVSLLLLGLEKTEDA